MHQQEGSVTGDPVGWSTAMFQPRLGTSDLIYRSCATGTTGALSSTVWREARKSWLDWLYWSRDYSSLTCLIPSPCGVGGRFAS